MKMAQGDHKVFADGSGDNCFGPFTKPNEIHINGKNQSIIQSFYQFDEEENIAKLIWKESITSCLGMFCNCGHILEINLTHFNTSLVTDMRIMFQQCYLLTSVDFSNVDTSQVTSFNGMFQYCYSLISLDLSSFETSRSTGFGCMFSNCKSLRELSISNFKTQNVLSMDKMFENCFSLTFLNFENINMNKVKNNEKMFFNCTNLEYVNLRNYKQSIILGNSYFFNESPKNLVVCTEDANLVNIIESHDCNIVNCLDDWYNYKKNIYPEDDECTDDCTLTNFRYEYNYICQLNCPKGTYNNNYKCEYCHPDCEECEGNYTINNSNCTSCSNPEKALKFGNCVDKKECLRNTYYNNILQQDICKCDLEQCFTCSLESLKKNLCTKCEEGNYPIYDDKYEYYPYLNCSNSPEGYYLDNKDAVYKLCFLSCRTCDQSGNETQHNCIECKYDYSFEILIGIKKNCYVNCSFYHYYDSGISYCTKNKECPKEFDKLLDDKNECVSNCTKDDYYKFEFRNHCYKECPSNSILRKNNTELEGFSLDKKYFCKPICFEEAPFEIIHTQECLKNCPMKYIIDKSCILNFQNPKTEEKKGKEEDAINNKDEKEE